MTLSYLELDARRRNWWRGTAVRFRVEESWGDSRGSDKLVHAFATASASRFYRGALRWSGVPPRDAELYGALAGWTQFLYLEVLDGFGPNWGFSPSDVLFNTVGAGFAFAQWRVPELQAYELKVSYWPSGQGGRRLTADHAGQTWWLTANPHLALPGPIGEAVPPWLNVAVGYGARRGEGDRDFTEGVVLVGLDLELRGLPIDHPVWNEAVEWLRYLHLPAPAVRLSPRPALVLLAY